VTNGNIIKNNCQAKYINLALPVVFTRQKDGENNKKTLKMPLIYFIDKQHVTLYTLSDFSLPTYVII